MNEERVLIVEGDTDRKRLLPILAEPVKIICTNGTVSPYRLEELLAPYEDWELYVFVDADDSGEKLRALFKREFSEAHHLYTDKIYREVATTPYKLLATILHAANFKVKTEYLF
ncbi:hypothetical protein [Sporosarcina sp. HYO08]|uniref:hypothetical protein n=1 Tax=Sporosarcina sp. HYO08 TaxID=1759557 RepID=UPI00079688FE|nr:hypothetical protein [Sporosarcina sp. HYO08]KXH79252.1 hypothetical protein AU377_11730 [Sporosarcina sp. HYO08]